jgi:hypothetical protein
MSTFHFLLETTSRLLTLFVAWWWIPTTAFASVLMSIPAGDSLTANSLLQLSTLNSSQSQNYATTDGQSVSLTLCQASPGAKDQDVSVVYSCCWPSPAHLFSVRVPRDSWPYFTVSDSRLPQPGGPGLHIYIPQEQRGPDIPLFVASYDSQCYGWGIRTRLHTGYSQPSRSCSL